jgi:hypothetical protein
MRATILNCTLKPSPPESNTEAQNLVAVARALADKPVPAPPSG